MIGRLLLKKSKNFVIEGHVSSGFETVKHQFQKYYQNGFDTHSQLCVYVGNEKVIDIYGKPADPESDYDQDKISNIFSSGKNIAAILMAILQD